MNEKYELHPLTLAQSEFAAKNHDLVFQYLRSRNLPEDEFYGEVILGYLSAVQRYEEESWLRQYRFLCRDGVRRQQLPEEPGPSAGTGSQF